MFSIRMLARAYAAGRSAFVFGYSEPLYSDPILVGYWTMGRDDERDDCAALASA